MAAGLDVEASVDWEAAGNAADACREVVALTAELRRGCARPAGVAAQVKRSGAARLTTTAS